MTVTVRAHPAAAHAGRGATPLASALRAALDAFATGDPTSRDDIGLGPLGADTIHLDDVGAVHPADERDELLALLAIHDLWLAPLSVTAGREVAQGHPAVASLKWQLERNLAQRLDARTPAVAPSADATTAMRRVAALHLVPAVYDWLAAEASWPELVAFLAIEGGPDAGFDDLVALAQVGIHGVPKVALAENYWDELGRGELDDVHTILHDRLVDAIDMPRVPRDELPVSALERIALGGLVATNRHLQPEMIGALGVIELQAGPRCRAVVRAMRRLDAPADALPFYEEHARADPRHGKDWLERVVTPLVEREPRWAPRIVRGAHWRHAVNERFFGEMLDRFATTEHAIGA